MELKDILFELSSAKGVGGVDGALNAARGMLEPLGTVKTDNFGGLSCVFGSGDRRIMLDAHLDEIGFVVTGVEGGFLRVAKCGGIDPRTVINMPVTVHSSVPVKGVFASMPPHLRADQKEAPEIDKLVVDCGMSPKKTAASVKVGDRVSFDCEPCMLLNDRVTGKSLDNRAGVAAVIAAAHDIAERRPDVTVIISLSSQEELGLRGARTAAFALEPHEAIAVDVSFGDGAGLRQNECGRLGGGPMIGVSPILDRAMTERLFDAAAQKGIECQREPMGGTTGTNADVITVTRGGVRCALVSIPLRNMHTCCETVDLKDIRSTADLITAYVCSQGE